MGPTDLAVEQGTPDDVTEAVALLDGARRWLHERSIDQWRHAIPAEVVLGDAERGALFLVRDQSGLQAIITVTDHDAETWGTDTAPALYVHRLAVAQASRGRGLGQELLSWASTRAADQRRTFVRLDCADDNHGLRRFYESQGFQHVRDTTVTAPESGRILGSSLYQRAVASPGRGPGRHGDERSDARRA